MIQQLNGGVITLYENIAAVTARMCAAAACQDWDLVQQVGQEYITSVEQLKMLVQTESITLAEHQARAHLLKIILENDARVRELATPELGRISDLLSTFNLQKSMLRAYARSPERHF